MIIEKVRKYYGAINNNCDPRTYCDQGRIATRVALRSRSHKTTVQSEQLRP